VSTAAAEATQSCFDTKAMQPFPVLMAHLPEATACGASIVAMTSAYCASRRKVKGMPARRMASSVKTWSCTASDGVRGWMPVLEVYTKCRMPAAAAASIAA